MTAYKRKYLKSIEAGVQDVVLCEVPACRRIAEHIHHIKEKGMGGRKDPDALNNLIGLCADCHGIAHSNDGRLPKAYLQGLAMARITDHEDRKGKTTDAF